MNKQEREQLRDSAEKAIRFQSLDAARQATSVIRVLDAWADTTEYPPEGQNEECEVHYGSEVSTTREVCDHQTHNICLCDWGDDCAMDNEPDFTYCPKCGEKL